MKAGRCCDNLCKTRLNSLFLSEMVPVMKIRSVFAVMLLSCLATAVLAADVDTVYRRNETKGFGGQITAANKTEVVVTQKVGNKEEHFPANEIERVEYQNEPAVLGIIRGQLSSGQFAQVLTGCQEAMTAAAAGNQNLKGEIDYLAIRALARIAQADATKVPAAIEKIKSFTNTYRDHYRFYPVQQILGETALLTKDIVTADSAFSLLKETPWPEYQLIGKAGIAKTLLAQDKIAEAKTIFDEVASASTTTPAEKTCQMEGMLGQAKCLEKSNQLDQATDVLKKIVQAASADETRLLAQTYLQLGNSYSLDGQRAKDAVLAYLHVDVIPTLASQSDLHAEALYNLSKLWPAIGQPARGAEASAKLQQDYPESEWTKKLAEGQ